MQRRLWHLLLYDRINTSVGRCLHEDLCKLPVQELASDLESDLALVTVLGSVMDLVLV